MIRRIAGVVIRPRATLVEIAKQPAWVATWSFILIVWAIIGGWLLWTEIGQQALIDERVRVIEALGGTVTDGEYARLQARPPWWVYFTSGGRFLLTPEVTLMTAAVLWLAARHDGARASWSQALAISVHASVILIVGQLIATPLHYVRESLTSPLNLAAILPMMEEGTLGGRFFGSLDLFALWWMGLLALGLSVLTRRGFGRYLRVATVIAVGTAGTVTAAFALLGGL